VEAVARAILGGRLPASLIAAGLFLATIYMPVVGGLLGLVAAVPAALVGWKAGLQGLVEVGVIAGVIVALATLQPFAPVAWLAAFWIPVGAGVLLLRRGPYFAGVGLGMALVILGGMAAWVLSLGGSPEDLVRGWVSEGVRAWVEGRGLPEADTQRVMGRLQEDLVPLAARFLPGAIGAGILLTWGVNLLVGLRLAAAAGEVPELGPVLRGFRVPDSALWLVIALGVLAWLGAEGPLGYWAANGLIVMGMPFLAQGLAVVHSARLAYGLARGWLVFFYILMGLLTQLVLAVVLLGLADVWADFRSKLDSADSS